MAMGIHFAVNILHLIIGQGDTPIASGAALAIYHRAKVCHIRTVDDFDYCC